MQQISIAVGSSRRTKTWQNRQISWSELSERLRNSTQTSETMAEYLAMSKDRQTDIKDVGGFVGGYLKDGLRNNASILSRSLITLDYDAMTPEHLYKIRLELGNNAFAVHSTHKYKPTAMRVRVIVPLSEDVTPEQYQVIARRLAERLGMEGIDESTFEPARMMFWPSHPRDVEPL